MNTHLHSSRPISSSLLGLFCAMGAVSFVAAAGPTPSAMETSPLAPLAFFTANEWEAKLPDSSEGKKMSIHARFTWAENRKAIRVSNQFMIDGKPEPYIDGLYAWNPLKKMLVFMYTDAEGNFSEGSVRIEEGKLVHEFQEIHPDGKVDALVARVSARERELGQRDLRAQGRCVDSALAGAVSAGAVKRRNRLSAEQ